MEQQQISSDLIRGHIDTIILHTLLDGDKFAQQISDAIEEKSEKEYKINQATLYSSLKRLESLKYVSSYWNDSDVGGRRKFFKLTDAGRESVENNLSSWSFSRAIIDKLMDCAPQPIYRTQYVEKIVEKTVETPPATISIETKKEEQQIQQSQQVQPTHEDTREINFRNILNGLIKSSSIHKQPETELEPVKIERIETAQIEKPKFNQTINETDYNAQRSNNGKIDFGDLTLKAAKEGYKIKISSKDSCVPQGTFLTNKLNLYAALAIYLVVMLEFLVYSFAFGSILNTSVALTIIIIAVFSLFPIIMAIKYYKDPKKCTNKKVSADSILTSAIIVFNLLLINLATALLFNLDFSNAFNSLIFVAIPITLYFDVLIYYIIKYFIAKNKIFSLKRKKVA